MTLFLFGVGFTVLLFAALKVAISYLRRTFPEGRVLFESVETYLWVPAALMALMLTLFLARMGC